MVRHNFLKQLRHDVTTKRKAKRLFVSRIEADSYLDWNQKKEAELAGLNMDLEAKDAEIKRLKEELSQLKDTSKT